MQCIKNDLSDIACCLVNRSSCLKALISGGDLNDILLHISGAYDYSVRYTEKVGIREHNTCADVSVIIDYLNTTALKLIGTFLKLVVHFFQWDA